jgi:Aspartyl protease
MTKGTNDKQIDILKRRNPEEMTMEELGAELKEMRRDFNLLEAIAWKNKDAEGIDDVVETMTRHLKPRDQTNCLMSGGAHIHEKMTREDLNIEYRATEKRIDELTDLAFKRDQESDTEDEPEEVINCLRNAPPIPMGRRISRVMATVNGKQYKALIDTGSVATVGHTRVAKDLNLMKELQNGTTTLAAVMGDSPGPFKEADVTLKLAGHHREVTMRFTDLGTLGSMDLFDIIIGGDTLEKYPPCSINFQDGTFEIGSNTIKMLD